MSALDRLTLAEIAPMMRSVLKDQSYRATPVGTMVGRYIRWLRNEYGATPSTIRDYEAILARMSVSLADRELIEVSTEDLREVIDLWAAQSARTRQKVTSVVRAFWAWCEEQAYIAISPAARIRRPRAPRRVARTLPVSARPRLLEAAKHPRDRLALFCLLGLGMRRQELARLRCGDFDPESGRVRIYGKGQKERVQYLRGVVLDELRLYLSADLPAVGRPPRSSDFLLYPIDRRANGKGSEGQMTYVHRGRPSEPMAVNTVHKWWYRIAAAAGLVAPGQTSGLNMHQARHLFATELRRVAGVEAASQALGHSDLSTTLGIYGHQDDSDLERAMGRYADWLDERIVPPNEEAE